MPISRSQDAMRAAYEGNATSTVLRQPIGTPFVMKYIQILVPRPFAEVAVGFDSVRRNSEMTSRSLKKAPARWVGMQGVKHS
jgi:hypothetical protein